MKLKELMKENENNINPNTISIREFKARKLDIISFIIQNLYTPINNEGIKSIIFEDFAELKKDLISIIKITPIENLLSSGINKYYFNLILQYSSEEEILNIISKNRTIKEYYENKNLIEIIKKDFR
jgi:hypothetical protein